jgi:hypothetical protein
MTTAIDASEMTPEQRHAEVVAILAAGFLRLRAAGITGQNQVETADLEQDKIQETCDQSLESGANPRLCGSQKEKP